MAASSLTMVRGDTPSFDLDINKPDGSAYDLSGATLIMSAKRHGDDPDYRAAFRKTSAGGSPTITITNAAGGLARVDMKAADTASVEAPADLWFDVQVSFPSGVVVTPIMGTLTVSADSTRA